MGFFNPWNSLLFVVSQTVRMDIKKLIIGLFRMIYIILFVYLAYQVLSAIIGGTWETENIIIAGIGIILTGLFVIVGFLINQGKNLGILEERTKNIGRSLFNLGNDFKQHLVNHK